MCASYYTLPAFRTSGSTTSGYSSDNLGMTIEVGQPAPQFSLRDKDRNEVTLDSYPGKNLVLAFYPLAFTGG